MTHRFRLLPLLLLPLLLLPLACGDDDKTGASDTRDTVLVTDGIVIDTSLDISDTTTPCDPVFQTGCAATDNCTYVAAQTAPTCFLKGPVAPEGECAAENRCETGICLSINRTADLCYQFCYEDEDCDEGRSCLALSSSLYKVCKIPGIYEDCNLLAQACTDDEAVDRACYAVLGEATPICLPAGTIPPGATCTNAAACQANYACVNDACRAVCDVTGVSSCGELATCRDFAHGTGFCEPN